MGGGSTEWDDFLNDDMFANWDNWPQFNPADFSDLFGDIFNWDPANDLSET
jgi:hypothetical protein